MKVAFAVWNQRIAPVFDVTRQIHVVAAESGRIVSETEESLPDDGGSGKVLRLTELGVDTLVCGAISRSMQAMIAAYGIRMIPFVAGDLREVIRAWLSGALEKRVFAMPGCSGRIHRRRLQCSSDDSREVDLMRGGSQGGVKPGWGQGRGQGQGQGQGKNCKGGQGGPGSKGDCVCPQCGHREPHRRGVPCTQQQCPKCGAAMTRE